MITIKVTAKHIKKNNGVTGFQKIKKAQKFNYTLSQIETFTV
jgi:hypothetical protein